MQLPSVSNRRQGDIELGEEGLCAPSHPQRLAPETYGRGEGGQSKVEKDSEGNQVIN